MLSLFLSAEDGFMNAFMISIYCNRVGCGRPVDVPREARSTDRAEGETKSRLPQISKRVKLKGLALFHFMFQYNESFI